MNINPVRKPSEIEDLSAYPHMTYVVGACQPQRGWISNLAPWPLDGAQLIASEISDRPGWHTVMLDIDLSARLVPSTTPDHFHLYVDHPMPWRRYKRLLRALAAAGVIERGYYKASVKRRGTCLRLPWVRKHEDDGLGGSA